MVRVHIGYASELEDQAFEMPVLVSGKHHSVPGLTCSSVDDPSGERQCNPQKFNDEQSKTQNKN